MVNGTEVTEKLLLNLQIHEVFSLRYFDTLK